jgi:hypothetical protein
MSSVARIWGTTKRAKRTKVEDAEKADVAERPRKDRERRLLEFRRFRQFRCRSHYRAAGGAGASLRVNSALLLRYQIVAPLKMTASRTISVSSMPKQDFIGWRKDAQLSPAPARSGLSSCRTEDFEIFNREWTRMDANRIQKGRLRLGWLENSRRFASLRGFQNPVARMPTAEKGGRLFRRSGVSSEPRKNAKMREI